MGPPRGMDDRIGAAVAGHDTSLQVGWRSRNPLKSGDLHSERTGPTKLELMRHATFIALLLAIAGCVHQRVRSAGERAHESFIWAADSGDPGTDAANTAIVAGWAAAAAATSHDPAVPFCVPETPDLVDPAHTCPAKAGEEPKPAENPR